MRRDRKLTIRISDELLKALEQEAEADDRKPAGVAHRVLENWRVTRMLKKAHEQENDTR